MFYLAGALVAYMPLHVFLAQAGSLLTGGIEVWKSGKDVLIFLLALPLLYLSWRQGLWKDRFFKTVLGTGLVYGLLHGLYLLFDGDDHTSTTLIASVYNTRLLVYLLLGYLVGSARSADRYMKRLFLWATCIAVAVSVFGLLQYFVLPHDFLEHFGYSLDRGVKPLFFIDDKPDLPRVMSTLKDPNSLGAYLIVPILAIGYSLLARKGSERIFGRRVPVPALLLGFLALVGCLLVTFSRGALIALGLTGVTILYIVTEKRLKVLDWRKYSKRYGAAFMLMIITLLVLLPRISQTYLFQNYVFHADESTVIADPNELRVQLFQDAVNDVIDEPQGHGPGTAGIVAIRNPKGGVLTENYYLQIAYEVGWLGIVLFIAILSLIMWRLYRVSRSGDVHAAILVSAGVGYLFYSLLIHLWSNEAIALQWWLLAGIVMATGRGQLKQPSKK